MKILHDDENVKISITEKENSNRVTIALASADLRYHGMDLPQGEFVRSAEAATTIFIVDKKISWANSLDFALIQRIAAPYVQNKTINTIGSSMGGFTAIVTSNFFNVSTVVSFVPQYTVNNEILPNDGRWNCFSHKIKTWKFPSLENQFNKTTQYYILAGTNGPDKRHLQRFPIQSNVHKIYFNHSQFHHDTARILKLNNMLYPVVEACYAHTSPEQIIIQHGLNRPDFLPYAPRGEI